MGRFTGRDWRHGANASRRARDHACEPAVRSCAISPRARNAIAATRRSRRYAAGDRSSPPVEKARCVLFGSERFRPIRSSRHQHRAPQARAGTLALDVAAPPAAWPVVVSQVLWRRGLGDRAACPTGALLAGALAGATFTGAVLGRLLGGPGVAVLGLALVAAAGALAAFIGFATNAGLAGAVLAGLATALTGAGAGTILRAGA